MAWVLYYERPDVIVSTGAETGIPAFVLGKPFGCQTTFVESWCRVETRSTTGRTVYPISDLFLVQWPGLVEEFASELGHEINVQIGHTDYEPDGENVEWFRFTDEETIQRLYATPTSWSHTRAPGRC